MTNFNLQELSAQLSSLTEHRLRERPRRRQALSKARQVLQSLSATWHEQRQDKINVPWLMARPLGDPTATTPTPERPSPLTACATDGSQIYPDRHIEPLVYLVNISRIAFQYGTLEMPVMSARTVVDSEHVDPLAFSEPRHTSADLVTALRDQMELDALCDLARESQRPKRPILALVDGTLIRWALNRLDEASKVSFVRQYADTLADFRASGIPVCSVISMPNSTEVVNLLRGLRGETRAPQEDTLAGVLDRRLYASLLEDGYRTAAFASASHVLDGYAESDRICFCYMRVTGRHSSSEIVRVEMPRWVAQDPSLLDLVHATVVSESAKGDGYPMILAEAHERAVIRTQDRNLFYRFIETEMDKHNLTHTTSRKHAAKRRPTV